MIVKDRGRREDAVRLSVMPDKNVSQYLGAGIGALGTKRRLLRLRHLFRLPNMFDEHG